MAIAEVLEPVKLQHGFCDRWLWFASMQVDRKGGSSLSWSTFDGPAEAHLGLAIIHGLTFAAWMCVDMVIAT